jgi:OmpA family
LESEKMTLANAATKFKTYEIYEGKASLVVVGHADVRGPEKYNQALSERRAALVKDYLVSQGIPAEKIQTRAEGKDQEIDVKAVETLESKDQEKPTKWMVKHKKTTWLAYNRRADIVLEPSGQQSAKVYPADSADARVLWQRPKPSLKKVAQASNMTTASVQQASLKPAGGSR